MSNDWQRACSDWSRILNSAVRWDRQVTSASPGGVLPKIGKGFCGLLPAWRPHNMRIKTLWQSTAHASPFGSRILLTAGTNGLSAVLGITTGMLAARLLGPQGRGELAAIQTWPSFIATLAMLGLPEALVYYSA